MALHHVNLCPRPRGYLEMPFTTPEEWLKREAVLKPDRSMADIRYTIKEQGDSARTTPVEQRLLVCSTELDLDSQHNQDLRHLVFLVEDKDFFINVAIKEGLACLLYKKLLKSGALDTLGHKQSEKLQSLYYQTLSFNLRLIRDLKYVLRHLNQNKIQVVLLQGIILLEQVYADVGLRPMTDIDLWVLGKDYPRLIDILADLGYQRDLIYPNTFRNGLTTLDIHTHILWADSIRARTLLLTKSQDHIFHNTRIVHFEGREARCLSQYDQVLYLSLHALKHNVDRLLWLVDIKHLVIDWEKSDWEALMNRARELGQEKSILYILFLLIHLIDFHLPGDASQLLEWKRLHITEQWLLRQRVEKDAFPIWAPLLLFCPERGFKRRFSYILETLFPRPEILRQIFEDSPHLKVWQLYWKRLLHLFGMTKMSLKRFLFGH